MNKPVLIIAEAGVNHNGDINLAKKLIDAAAEANADYVKFQTFKTELVITKQASMAPYQVSLTNAGLSQFDMVKRLELSYADFDILCKHCEKNNIKFLTTPFDLPSVEYMAGLDLDFYKIPSGEITNLPYLRLIGGYGKKIILSTGMSYLDEVKNAINILVNAGTNKSNITVMHCNTEYPTPMEDVNLRAMVTLKRELGTNAGYSDHTMGIEVPVAAVALGATIIEKHFTLDKKMDGPDHSASLEPGELKSMIIAIRNVEKSMGDGVKLPSQSELNNLAVARKSIVASRPIRAGEAFTHENITVKRPGTGVSPMKWDFYIGRIATKDYQVDEMID